VIWQRVPKRCRKDRPSMVPSYGRPSGSCTDARQLRQQPRGLGATLDPGEPCASQSG
jgi:hypothetical protein